MLGRLLPCDLYAITSDDVVDEMQVGDAGMCPKKQQASREKRMAGSMVSMLSNESLTISTV